MCQKVLEELVRLEILIGLGSNLLFSKNINKKDKL